MRTIWATKTYLVCLLYQTLVFHPGHLDVGLDAEALSICALAKRDSDVNLRVLYGIFLALLTSDEVERAGEASWLYMRL